MSVEFFLIFLDDFRKTACVSVVRYIIENQNNPSKHCSLLDYEKAVRHKFSFSDSMKESKLYDSSSSENEEAYSFESILRKLDLNDSENQNTDTDSCILSLSKEQKTGDFAKESDRQTEAKRTPVEVNECDVVSVAKPRSISRAVKTLANKSTNTSYMYTGVKRSEISTHPLVLNKTEKTTFSDKNSDKYDFTKVLNEATRIQQAISSHVMKTAAILKAEENDGDKSLGIRQKSKRNRLLVLSKCKIF